MAHAERIIFDTDIGTDVDDALALALILCSPELQLEGVTCVYGDVDLRARMVLKMLQLRGHTDVPVTVGLRQPLLGIQPVFWLGHEGHGLLEPEDEALAPEREHAVDFIVRTIMENPGQIHLIAVGPLTNVAMAFLREPRLPEQLAQLTIMGGVVRGPDDLHLPYAEHNIRCDPEAAHVVLSSGARITLIPLDVTTKVRITREGTERIRAGGTAFHDAVARQVELYPPFAERGYTFMHDPLAAAVVIRPDLVRMEGLHVDVELHGRHAAAATLARTPTNDASANARVALEVDAGAFEEFYLSRLEEAKASADTGA
jgi:purine nucleosidase